MIRLTKGDEPIVLRDHREAWEQALRDHATNGTEATKSELGKYNHPEIKEALLVETAEKCAYCESKLRHITYGDIEHIVPKKLGLEHRFKWENLTIGCDVCNTKKGIKEDLIDPYVDDPDQEFLLIGPMVLANPESDRAKITESALQLNRKALLERRAERLNELHKLLQIALLMPQEAHRQVLFDQLRNVETADDVEYAAICRSYIRELEARGILPPAS